MTRILNNTQDLNDGSPEARLLKKSEVFGVSKEVNSFRIFRVTADSEDLDAIDADESSDIAGDKLDPRTKELKVSMDSMRAGLKKFTNELNSSGQSKGIVAVEILHVHPLVEILFTDRPNNPDFAIFPPSASDVEFAKETSMRMGGLPVILSVLTPNGYKYSMAFINDKNATVDVLKNMHEI